MGEGIWVCCVCRGDWGREGGMGCSVVCVWCLASSHADKYIHPHTHTHSHILTLFVSFFLYSPS